MEGVLDFNKTYLTRDDLVSEVKSFYLSQGYIVVIKRSKKGKVWLVCDLGGEYRNYHGLTEEARQRATSSRRNGCNFELSGVYQVKDNSWHIIVIELAHNHPPARNLSGHSIVRRLKPEERKTAVSLCESGIGPSQILNVLKNDFGNTLSTRKEIHNYLAFARKEFLNGLSPIQKLLELLENGSFIYSYETSDTGTIKSLFFSHKKSVKLCRKFFNVFIMDCTYKTNRFGMPLLNIVGVTSTYHSFNAGFIFMPEEIEIISGH